MNETYDINRLTDHLFRRESGKMVSVLTKIFGTENLQTAEDVVQQTFIDAINIWKLKGIPDNPAGWLFRVAKNKAIDVVRKNKHSVQFDFNDIEKKPLTSEYTLNGAMENFWKEEFIKDDLLRMMFTCCHPDISQVNQVTLILKTLCGFSTAEIAKAFLTSEDTVSKRLYRTKEFFRQQRLAFVFPPLDQVKSRTNAVLNAIYLLFNEGYNATHADQLIRKDLIEEAMMLCRLLAENKFTQLPETHALMALMYFHSARSESRLTTEGEIILLPYQDRSKWNLDFIRSGNEYMNKAAIGDEISSYHLEAAIAYEHCIAEDFSKTNWNRILELYEWLSRISSSPVIELNRAVAILQMNGPAAALKAVKAITDKNTMEHFYLYHSLLGEIHTRLNNTKEATDCYRIAMNLTQSVTEKNLLANKIKTVAL